MQRRSFATVAIILGLVGCRDQTEPSEPIRVHSVALVAEPPGDSSYVMEDLGPADHPWCCNDPGDAGSLENNHILFINEAGTIAGSVFPDPSNPTGLGLVFTWSHGVFQTLGNLGGGHAFVTALNNRGTAAGCAPVPSGFEHAVIWESGTITDLGTLGGVESCANSIDEVGSVVGSSRVADGSKHAFRWSRRDGMVDLGTLGGTFADAIATTENGRVVGQTRDASGNPRGFVWQRDKMSDLGDIPGVPDGATQVTIAATGLNNAGTIVGRLLYQRPPGHFFRDGRAWVRQRSGEMTVIAPTVSGYNIAIALAVNARGQVLGLSEPFGEGGDRFSEPWIWENGTLTPVDAVRPPELQTRGALARAMNDDGVVVGMTYTVPGFPLGGVQHAFVSVNGVISDLGTLGGATAAEAINNRGDIVGISVNEQNEARLVLWRKK